MLNINDTKITSHTGEDRCKGFDTQQLCETAACQGCVWKMGLTMTHSCTFKKRQVLHSPQYSEAQYFESIVVSLIERCYH